MIGIAINRLGLTPSEFYRLSPIEFQQALHDHDQVYFSWVRLICETLRQIGITIHNSAFGREKKDMVSNPEEYIKFSWDKPKIQTVEEMKRTIMGLTHFANVQVKQGDKIVKLNEEEET